MKKYKGEKLEKDLKDKQVFYFYDTEKNIERLSKEIYKNKDEIVHYPRGFDGGQKYKTIEKFRFIGFKRKLPVGVNKSVAFGYGFTRTLKPFAKFLDEKYKFKEVIIKKTGKMELDVDNKILFLTEKNLEKLQRDLGNVFKRNKIVVDLALGNLLHQLLPKNFKKPPEKYIANTLATSLSAWGNSIDEFSGEDKESIKELFEKLSLNTDFLTENSLAKTKELVDNKYIQETLKKYKGLMSAPKETKGVEKKWQAFLKLNSWIFSSIFAQPVILYQDEAYVGGKTISNTNGKFNDFLIKNNLSNNVSFLEIKTHKTELLEKSSYRGTDVYSASKDLTGCTSQVLNQRDNFQKSFYNIKGTSKGDFETFNSKCVVLIGSISQLDNNQKYSFELFRSNSRDVDILTFDELQNKLKSLQDLMLKQS